MLFRTWVVLAVFGAWPLSARGGEGTIYVDADATGPMFDGSSWCTAFVDIQSALTAVRNGEGNEIRVAQGRYTPGPPGASQSVTFLLDRAVTFRGGFAGCGAPDPDEQDPIATPTILDGDLLGDDLPAFINRSDNVFAVVTVAIGAGAVHLDGLTIRGGNSTTNGAGLFIHSTVAPGVEVNACTFEENLAAFGGAGILGGNGRPLTVTNSRFLNNFSISGGVAVGGALWIQHPGTTVSDCLFVGNSASRGGALYIGASATISDSQFTGNTAEQGGAIYLLAPDTLVEGSTFTMNEATGAPAPGGAIWAGSLAGGIVQGCDFTDNVAARGGAAFLQSMNDLAFIRCRFVGNQAGFGGGAVLTSQLSSQSASFTNCLFRANSSGMRGGAIFAILDRPPLVNCTVVENSTNGSGGGISQDAPSTIVNTILWDNTAASGTLASAQIHLSGGAGNPDITYSCIEGWTGGGLRNISTDPMLDENQGLTDGSPCIDAGNNEALPPDVADVDQDGDIAEPLPLDLAGTPRLANDRFVRDKGNGGPPTVDMGALERQSDCNKNLILDSVEVLSGQAVDDNANGIPDECDCDLYGDLDDSGIIDIDDLLCAVQGFSQIAACPQADIFPCGGDSRIDLDDLLETIRAFGGNATCPDDCP